MLPLGFHSLSEDPQKNLLSRAFISKEFGGLPNGIFFFLSMMRIVRDNCNLDWNLRRTAGR